MVTGTSSKKGRLAMKPTIFVFAMWLISLTCVPFTLHAEEAQLLWGDTHLHSSYSTDAFIAGNRDTDPDAAYRFAKGEPVVHPFNRTRVQLSRPLDFLAVADHAEALGVMAELYATDPDLSTQWFWKRWGAAFILGQLRDTLADPLSAYKELAGTMPEPQILPGDIADPIATAPSDGVTGALSSLLTDEIVSDLAATMWQRSMSAADAHNDPGTFTTLVGWEWTQVNNGVNLHRVVLSTLDGEAASQIVPIDADRTPYPEQLWEGLEQLTVETGARFLAIPHNSNVSKGYMFADRQTNGDPLTEAYVRTRAAWEPVMEVTQIKGDSETHPVLSPNDEFADFERFEFYLQRPPQGPTYQPAAGDFARTALMQGLEIEERLGTNPFQFGMIGSTDSHTGLTGVDEPNFLGMFPTDSIPDNKRLDDETYEPGVEVMDGWNMSASGRAAVWARENTREAIFDAFARKEVYATTGPRIALRLFAGWSYDETAASAHDLAEIGYAGGVPMGGDLTAAPSDASVKLLIQASKDPLDANLDRVQVIKGWLDAKGQTHEAIFNVAWSDDRPIDLEGKLPPVGNSVDIETGVTSNEIGAADLSTVWTDPTFDPTQKAFYYVRVLQVPTIRHSQLDAIALGQETPYEAPATIQERAYSSPIWFKPS
jgi:hypothetical protein